MLYVFELMSFKNKFAQCEEAIGFIYQVSRMDYQEGLQASFDVQNKHWWGIINSSSKIFYKSIQF